nr:MAG TPA: hypothetical protein [Bacteriophage sp.]
MKGGDKNVYILYALIRTYVLFSRWYTRRDHNKEEHENVG